MPNRAREKFKTEHTVFDAFTNRNIFKLIAEGQFEGLISPVSVGKEANIFSARCRDKSVKIVKIYRLETCDFNRMYDYLKYDPRYLGLKKKRRQIIFSWTQREFRNLLIAREAGVRVPTPLSLKHNIIVMELIGDKTPAPKLKDQYPEDPEKFSKELISSIKKLYSAGIVHGDLSAFNILNWNDHPVLIDFSQSTSTESPTADELLKRDMKIMVTFFAKLGLKLDLDKILKEIKSK